MKELSIEEKAKRYDEALERAKEINNEQHAQPFDVMLKVFPELKKSEDERIRETLIDYLKERKSCESYGQYIVRYDHWIAWLEKQGKQKSIDDLTQQEVMDIAVTKCFEQGKQKLADKAEPKFHEGDWIICCDYEPVQIISIRTNVNAYEMSNGDIRPFYIIDNNPNIRLWTIQDAKDGNVLSDGTTIFIFKDLLSDDSVMSYCDYDKDSGESDAFCPLSMNLMCSKITPAIKEQSDTLERAMANAGYRWDKEKLKLEKI